MLDLNEQILKLHQLQASYVLVTLVNIVGSAPQVIGAKMLVTQEGLFWGTVGGGKIEAHSIQHGQKLLSSQSLSEIQTWNLQKQIGMSCGGEVSLFFDVQIQNPWVINIFGAGHISQELCRVLSKLSCQLNIYDTRPEWLSKLPVGSNIKTNLYDDLASAVPLLAENSFALCMTQGHGTDFPILLQVFKNSKHFKFIGVIGSDIKSKKIKTELNEAKIPDHEIERLHCPLGLPIGNNTPAEIAISIAAQLLAVRDQVNLIST